MGEGKPDYPDHTGLNLIGSDLLDFLHTATNFSHSIGGHCLNYEENP